MGRFLRRWIYFYLLNMVITMVEIYKVIAFIPLLDQIFDDKNKNGSVKVANNNQVYMRGNFELVSFCQRVFDICDIPLRSHSVSDDNNPSQYAITYIFPPWLLPCSLPKVVLHTKLMDIFDLNHECHKKVENRRRNLRLN